MGTPELTRASGPYDIITAGRLTNRRVRSAFLAHQLW